jgi:hypothetical protein
MQRCNARRHHPSYLPKEKLRKLYVAGASRQIHQSTAPYQRVQGKSARQLATIHSHLDLVSMLSAALDNGARGERVTVSLRSCADAC